jgi:hypothetical protein
MNEDSAAARPLAGRDDMRAIVRRWLTSANVSTRRRRLIDFAALGTVFGIAGLSYWWTRAPVYNPAGTIDPWLYTALFVNFDQIYEPFGETYYAARLPWVVPGRILYSALPLDAAYWVLHGLAFCGGVTALFFLVRRYLGVAPAVVGAATLALTPMYWNAQYWDYIDGVMITYLLGGLCFGLPSATGRRRAASLTAAGVFFAAAVTTNLLAAMFAVIYPIVYVFVEPAAGFRPRVVLAIKDLAALLVGAAGLVVALGLYARANGGLFLFFEPQVDVVRYGAIGSSKIAGYEWLRSEGRLVVPVVLAALGTPLLVLGRRLPQFRFAAGSIAALAVLTAFAYGWEFFAGGAILDYTYAFSSFAIAIAFAMSSIAALLAALVRPHWATHAGGAAAATGAGVLALGMIYADERAEWTGRAGFRISVAVFAVAAVLILAALLTRRTWVGPVAAVAAIGSLAFGAHFAIDSSSGIYIWGASAPDNRSLYHAAADNVAFVNRATASDEPMPRFWYAGNRPEFTAMQSMYYYAFTAIGYHLPKVAADVRQRLDAWKPQSIVMLCETRHCEGGAAALRRAGYPYREDKAQRISRGRIHLWTILLRSSGGPATDARCEARRLQDGDLLRAPPGSEIYAVWDGRKHWIASMDVLLDVFGPNAVPAIKNVRLITLEVLPSGRSLTSAKAWARIRGGSRDRRPRRPAC